MSPPFTAKGWVHAWEAAGGNIERYGQFWRLGVPMDEREPVLRQLLSNLDRDPDAMSAIRFYLAGRP